MIPQNVNPQVRRALEFALTNIGVCEDPPGSNRSPEIDTWAKEFDSPLGSRWCALAVAKARKEGGLWIPTQFAGSCDEWLHEGKQLGLVSSAPLPGAAVLYTNGATITGGRYDGQPDAVHIGLVLRSTPVLMDIEGNTTLGEFSHNGFVQALKVVDQRRVLAYIAPEVSP
jgi:hypothetical protein